MTNKNDLGADAAAVESAGSSVPDAAPHADLHPLQLQAMERLSKDRLAQAAPELLAALKAVLPMWDRGLSDAVKTFVLRHHERDTFDEVGAMVKAAISKAEGKV